MRDVVLDPGVEAEAKQQRSRVPNHQGQTMPLVATSQCQPDRQGMFDPCTVLVDDMLTFCSARLVFEHIATDGHRDPSLALRCGLIRNLSSTSSHILIALLCRPTVPATTTTTNARRSVQRATPALQPPTSSRSTRTSIRSTSICLVRHLPLHVCPWRRILALRYETHIAAS